MKKTMQYLRLSFICCLSLVVFAGCQPDSWEFTSNVKFSASTGYDNLLTTKTVYSGEDVTISGTTYERIDWVNNDQIRVMAYNVKTGWNEAYADYKVSGTITPSGRYSTAEVNKVGERGLNWNSTNVNSDVFYAIYPSPAVNSNANISVSSNYATIGGTIPDSQSYTTLNMNNAYMYAAKQANRTDSEVTLEFKPAFTAFQITINNDSGAPFTITSFELSSASSVLTGPFTGNITSVATAATQFSTTGTNKKITVTNLPTTAIAAGSSTSVTLFALPCNLTDLSIIMTADNGTTTATKKLELKQGSNFITFAGGKKYRINVGAPALEDPWIFVVEPIDDITLYGHSNASGNFNVKSYKHRTSDPTASNKTAVAWKIQYTTDGSTWTDLPAGGVTPASDTTYQVTTSPTGSGVNTSTYSTGEGRTANIIGSHNASTISGDPAPIIALAHLQNAEPRPHGVSNPGPSTAFDLSMHPVYGNIDTPYTNGANTANCYTISAPGWYKFPIVYGNAIKNGSDNKSAYWPANSSSGISNINTTYNTDNFVQHYYLPQFYNAYNELIDEPYVLEDLNENENVNVLVLWQDTYQGEEIIPYPTGNATPDNIGIITENGHKYIWFKIEAENIKPGNLVIALRSNDYILWSWHIWVTDKDLTPTDNLRGFDLMPANLGYVDGNDGASEQYKSRGMKFRVIQTETDGTSEEFIVNQIGEVITFAPSIGANPYYQWGRKDPIIPSLPGGGTKQVSPNPQYSGQIPATGGSSVSMGTVSTVYTDYSSGIKYPWEPLFNQNTSGWVGGPVYPYFQLNGTPYTAAQRSAAACPYNLWNAYIYADTYAGNSTAADRKYKTIYDPCPPGFTVPVRHIFTQASWPLTWRAATSIPETTPVIRDDRTPMSGTTIDRSTTKGASYDGVFFPYSGGRIIIGHTGGGADLEPRGIGSIGYYWSDHPFNMQPKYEDNNDPGYNPPPFNGSNISHHWFYQYGLIFSTQNQDYGLGLERVWSFTRGSGATIRPMKDPKF